ncbi:MAG: zf-HC2 domain-containing protein [Candidatus Hydrogenedentes bacterium]|nr:zf-HC2 domain-containing protein [Candidatus Hydrogenedentota bacterium]
MNNKDDIRDQFSPLLDGELSPEERASVEAALSDDAELLRELDSMKRVDDLFRAMPAVTAPDDFEVIVRDRIAPPRVAAVAAAAAPMPVRNVVRRRFAPLLAAAASLVVCAAGLMYVVGRVSNREQLAEYDVEAMPAPARLENASVAQTSAPAPSVAADAVSPKGMIGGRAKEETLSAMPESAPTAATPPPSDAPRDSTLGMPLQVADALPEQPATLELKEDAADKGERDERQRVGAEGAMPKPLSIAKPVSPDASGPPYASAAAPAPDEPMPAPAEPPAIAAGSVVQEDESVPPPMPEISALAPAEEKAEAVEPGAVSRSSTAMPMAEASKPAKAKTANRPDASSVQRTIGARSFMLRGGVWYERGYGDEATVVLLRDSDAFRALVKEYANVEKLLELKEAVVFKAGDHWYKMPPLQSSE